MRTPPLAIIRRYVANFSPKRGSRSKLQGVVLSKLDYVVQVSKVIRQTLISQTNISQRSEQEAEVEGLERLSRLHVKVICQSMKSQVEKGYRSRHLEADNNKLFLRLMVIKSHSGKATTNRRNEKIRKESKLLTCIREEAGEAEESEVNGLHPMVTDSTI